MTKSHKTKMISGKFSIFATLLLRVKPHSHPHCIPHALWINEIARSHTGQTSSTLHSSWATCIRPVITGCGPRKASWIIQTCVVLFHGSGKCNFPSQFAGVLIESAHGDMAAHGHQRTVALTKSYVCLFWIN